MRALCLNCTLKPSPQESNTEGLARVVLDAIGSYGVETELVRVVDHRIDPGVVSEAITDGDEWPALRAKIVAADILLVATPTWHGQQSSVVKRVTERMDALLGETREDGETPIAYNRVAGIVVTGNEDGAHHVIAELSQALFDTGYTIPGQAWTYWNKGPGPGAEEYGNSDEHDWSHATGRAAASNLVAVARALAANPVPAPPS